MQRCVILGFRVRTGLCLENVIVGTSPLNTQLDENELAGCSNDSYIDSASEPKDEIPSYQPIKKLTEITAKNQRNGESNKRKAEVKFQILRLHFWVQLYTKANVSEIIPSFVTQYQPSVPNIKNVLMEKWHLIQN